MVVIKESTVDATKFFNLDGLDYEKGIYTIFYDSVQLDGSGNVIKPTTRVGIKSKYEQSKILVRPRNISEFSDGVSSYGDLDTLTLDIVDLINFSNGGGGGGGIEISQKATNYSSLTAGSSVGDLAYVEESQGTAWLPGSLGGSYYPAGWYVWDGSVWVSDRNAIANALNDVINGLSNISEEDITGTSIEDATLTGAESIDLSTHVDAYYTLTGNTTISVTNTPTADTSFVRTWSIESNGGTETLTLPVGWVIIGTYDPTVANYLTIKFSNYTTQGEVVVCHINQDD